MIKKAMFGALSLLLIITMVVTGCTTTPEQTRTLPGQTEPASRLLMETIEEVESKSGKEMIFRNKKDHPDPEERNVPSIIVISEDEAEAEVEVWVKPDLDHDMQEVEVAHELAHVIQHIEGYPYVTLSNDEWARDDSFFKAFEEELRNLLLNADADEWAIQRGFNFKEYNKCIMLPRCTESLEELLNSDYVEAEADWEKYYVWLNNFVNKGEIVQRDDVLNEITMQMLVIRYADYYLRLSQYNLLIEIDKIYSKNFPRSWELGKSLVSLIEENGYSNAEKCTNTIIKVIEYLCIPPGIVVVRNCKTGEIIWPLELQN